MCCNLDEEDRFIDTNGKGIFSKRKSKDIYYKKEFLFLRGNALVRLSFWEYIDLLKLSAR